MSAWIEIIDDKEFWCYCLVAPFAGAWIEIMEIPKTEAPNFVAPFAGAWIEMVLRERIR